MIVGALKRRHDIQYNDTKPNATTATQLLSYSAKQQKYPELNY
jgi:hypothetical protein